MRLLTLLGIAAATAVANAQVAMLTDASALIDGDSLVGIAFEIDEIDQFIEWNRVGSVFDEAFTDSASVFGSVSIFDVDGGSLQSISQTSIIDGAIGGAFAGVSTTSSATGSMFDNGPDDLAQTSFLNSELQLEFTVNDPDAVYTLEGVLNSTRVGPTAELSSRILLRRFEGNIPVETIIQSQTNRPDPDFPFAIDLSGPITPGEWVLLIEIVGNVANPGVGETNTSTFSWDVDFTVAAPPCPADLAAPTGTLDFFDVLEYLARFDAADPSADLAAPLGTFDFFDVLEYLALFDAGC